MYYETRTELSDNDLLDIELGKIPSAEAVRLLLEDLRAEQQYATELQAYAEKLEDRLNAAVRGAEATVSEAQELLDKLEAPL